MTIEVEATLVVELDGQGDTARAWAEVASFEGANSPPGPLIGALALPTWMENRQVTAAEPGVTMTPPPAMDLFGFLPANNSQVLAGVFRVQAPSAAWGFNLTDPGLKITVTRLEDFGFVISRTAGAVGNYRFQIELTHAGETPVEYEFALSRSHSGGGA